jgi:TonB-linked SusC/RagA family outer membrane protein
VINERNTLRLLGSFFAEANLLKGLRFRMNFGPDFRSYNNGQFQYKESALRGGGAPTSTNFASYNTAQQIAWTLENILFYDRTFSNDHRVGLTLLQSSSMMQEENSNMTATNLPYNSQLWYNLGSTSRGALDRWGSGYSRMNLLSYMARVNYSFKDKYLLTVSGRWDGASVLAPGNKWDFFPSMAIAWKMSEEPFLQNVTWLNELKPRIGLGSTGNSSVRPYTTMGAVLQIPYVFGSTPANGFIPSNPKGAADEQGSIPNPSLSWERTEQWNFGIDFGVLNDRVTGSIDYYIADTYDLIMDKSVNRVTGYGSIVENIGRTQNKGIEVSLTSVNIDQGDFRWTSNITFSRNDQQIVELQEGPFDNVSRRWFIGRPLQVYYDYKKIGIWQLEDADVMAQFNANGATYKPGDIRVEDVNGDFRIDPTNDYQILGSSYPKWNGGITNTFTYKGVELSAFVYARWGNMIEGGAVDMQGRYASRKVDYWTVDNPTNAYPRADYSNGGVPVHYAAMNYQDGSFIKVRYISLGYTLPRTLIQRAGFNHLKIYTQVLNPFLYAKVDFMDPEISFQNNAANTSGSAISSRSLVFGLNASF